jgi:hypothetical protein
MFGRWFQRAAPLQPDTTAWWREANALALAPDADRIAALRTSVVDPTLAPDAAESQDEMLEGLDRVLELSSTPALPIIDTQHRVIGHSVCHFLAPASLVDQVDAAGKLFATAERLVFAAGAASGVQQWPWHSVASVTRIERDVLVERRGQAAVHLRLNTYGDALVMVALIWRLRANRP